jgi:hypothetical protein
MTKPYDQTHAFEVAEFKALDDKKGEFEALVSVFGNIDHGPDPCHLEPHVGEP